MIWLFSYLLVTLIMSTAHAVTPTIKTVLQQPDKCTIAVNFALKPHEALYADFIDFSVNHKALSLSAWHSNQKVTQLYDHRFQRTMRVFKNDTTLELQAQKEDQASLEYSAAYITYLTTHAPGLQQAIIPLTFSTPAQAQEPLPDTQPVATVEKIKDQKQVTPTRTLIEQSSQTVTKKLQNVKEKLFTLIKSDKAWWLRFLLIFLLGVLVSLTPCIYPMIPITVGVLGASASRSVWYNFLLALTYTLGVSSTFAVFGLIAATTGQMFGQILANPIFIIVLVLLLGYLALSLFDVYELYIPSFMRSSQTSTPHGSLISAFIFGAASGTISSPCLSPGLALVLSIVASLGNKLLGFLLLFAFGVGTSIPLLIIGTFSSSLTLLPRAGSWMIEIKKLFGFLLFGMCFYYLSTLLPYTILLALGALFCFGAGIYYFATTHPSDSWGVKRFKNLLGTAFIIGGVFLAYTAAKQWYRPVVADTFFATNYQGAVRQATQEHKKLFIDIGAAYCSICKLIDRTLMQDKLVRQTLTQFVPVKVDATTTDQEPYKSLKERYKILGVPTFLLIDPTTGELIKQWGAEINDLPPQEFSTQLEQAAKA